jgi:hypothetical protein
MGQPGRDYDWNYWDNSPHMYNMNDGNVGVGTTTPEEQLHVYGGFRVDGSSSHLFFVDSTSGNVGIGTDSPAAKLDVAGMVKMSGFQLTQGTVLDGWVLTAQGPNGIGEWEPLSDSLPPEMVNGSGTPGWIPMYKDADSLCDSPMFNSGGKIGLGTITADSMVHIKGDDAYITMEDPTQYGGIGFKAVNHTGATIGSVYFGENTKDLNFRGYHDADLVFWSDNTRNMVLDISGRLGIGTTHPQRTCHINDTMRLEPRSTAPSDPAEGDLYYDAIDHMLKFYDGTAWRDCAP